MRLSTATFRISGARMRSERRALVAMCRRGNLTVHCTNGVPYTQLRPFWAVIWRTLSDGGTGHGQRPQ